MFSRKWQPLEMKKIIIKIQKISKKKHTIKTNNIE